VSQKGNHRAEIYSMPLIFISRYGQVIAVVGMNPNKKYLVSPEERVRLIRSMLSSNEHLNNVKAQGMQSLSIY
jgi:phosphopantetheine adenylyltransferase